jgi:hypothetical protein
MPTAMPISCSPDVMARAARLSALAAVAQPL